MHSNSSSRPYAFIPDYAFAEFAAMRGGGCADVLPVLQMADNKAQAELQASEEDLRDVLVSLLAEVALNYVEVRSLEARLTVANANVEAQEETYNITQRWASASP